MIEYRTVAEMKGDGDTLHGLVTPFNTWTNIGDITRDGFKERVAPGTFTKTLQERDVVLIHSHNTAMPMARTSISSGTGSLDLREDPAAGLRAVAKPVQTTYAKDVMLCADAGVIRGMSFGFEVIKDEWTDDEGRASDAQRGTRRTIREVRLHEVTTTAFPAYSDTQLSARDTVSAAREGRAAVATYADLHTCAGCGATSQYDQFCTGCGQPMGDSESAGGFCGCCGAAIDGTRSAHVCAEKRESPGDAILGAVALIISGVNALPEDQRAAKLAEVRDQIAPGNDSNVDGSLPADKIICPTCGRTAPEGPPHDGDEDGEIDPDPNSRDNGAGSATPEEDASKDARVEAAALAAVYGIRTETDR